MRTGRNPCMRIFSRGSQTQLLLLRFLRWNWEFERGIRNDPSLSFDFTVITFLITPGIMDVCSVPLPATVLCIYVRVRQKNAYLFL